MSLDNEMAEDHWYAPVWSDLKEVREILPTLVYPDWSNIAPDFVSNLRQSKDSGKIHGQPSASTAYSFKRQKLIDNKFPLAKSLRFSYPMLHPRRIPSSKVGTNVNDLLYGNCLDTVEMNGLPYLVHPEWENGQQRVALSKLGQGSCFDESESQENAQLFKLEKVTSLPQDNCVQQVVAKTVNNDSYVLLRSPANAQLVSLHDGKDHVFNSTRFDIVNEFVTTDVALSGDLPSLWALACADGEVFVQNAQGREPLWHANFEKDGVNSEVCLYQCDFGRHPSSLLVGNEAAIYLCDTRVQHKDIHKIPRGSTSVRTVVSVEEMKSCIPDFLKICFFSQVKNRPHLYAVTPNSLLVIDERYCKTPVNYWKHMLWKQPSYIHTQKIGDLEFLMVADKIEKKVSMIANKWLSSKHTAWCRTESLPKHFQVAQDTMNFAHRQNLWFCHPVQRRLDCNWQGVASLVNPLDETSFLLFSLYNNGDIFSQAFKVNDSEADRVDNIPVPEEGTDLGKDVLSKWEAKVIDLSVTEPLGNIGNFKYFDASVFNHHVVNKSISKEIDDMLDGLPDIMGDLANSDDDDLQCLKSNATQRKYDVWNIMECMKLRKLKEKGIRRRNKGKLNDRKFDWMQSVFDSYVVDYKSHLAGDNFEECVTEKMASFVKVKNLKNYKDTIAPKILSPWLEKSAVGGKKPGMSSKRGSSSQPAFRYHTAPFNMSDLTTLPSKLTGPSVPSASPEVPDLDFDELGEALQTSQSLSQDWLSQDESSQTSQSSQTVSNRLKRTPKRKINKKRVDGF